MESRGREPTWHGGQAWQAWQTACLRLTTRAERLSPTLALLDLGICTDAEAMTALSGLLKHLEHLGIAARAGIGPSGVLAELALLDIPRTTPVLGGKGMSHAPAWKAVQPTPLPQKAAQTAARPVHPVHPVRLIAPEEAAAVLHTTPVTLLPHLAVAGIARELSPAVVERLQNYGLRTLGHVARLGELALRRQFGTGAGALLAAIATGHDPRPLSPTPPPASVRVRIRLPDGAVESAQLAAALPSLAEQMARQLQALGQRAGTLQVAVRWEAGGWQQGTQTFRQPTSDQALLLDGVRRLLLPLLKPDQPSPLDQSDQSDPLDPSDPSGGRIADLRLTLLDLTPVAPEQAAFWRLSPRAQRYAALDAVADTLTRRHGKPLLLAPRLVAPDAVFAEERHILHALHDVAPACPATTETMAPTLPSAAPVSSVASAASAASSRDAWQAVPHRLHWW